VIGNWGLYIGLPSKQVLAVDLYGGEVFYKSYPMNEGKVIYFNNLPVKKEKLEENYAEGQKSYCLMRKNSFQTKLAHYLKQTKKSKKDISSYDLLLLLGTPNLNQSVCYDFPEDLSQSWNLDTVTPSSLQIITMNPSAQEVLYVPGSCPKILPTKILRITDMWSEVLNQEMIHFPGTSINNRALMAKFRHGYSLLSKAGAHYDQKQFPDAFHQIQLAIEFLEGFYEKNIAIFFFLVYQYIHLENQRDHLSLLPQFHEIKNKLPPYLREQTYLFIMRIERIHSVVDSIDPQDFKIAELKNRMLFEKRLPRFILKKLKKLIFPQIATIDILYGYNIKH
jgi:hypothetical protein